MRGLPHDYDDWARDGATGSAPFTSVLCDGILCDGFIWRYLWDELAACAWLEPSIITKERLLYMDVDISHGPSYGHTLTWGEELRPAGPLQPVHAQVDVDLPAFRRQFIGLMTAPTPHAPQR